jgi:hypothetical protein
MGQMAGAPVQGIGGQTGMFGSLMQQAMQAAQGGGGRQPVGGQDAGVARGAAPSSAGPVGQQPLRDNAVDANAGQAPHPHEHQRDEREPLQRAMSGPSVSDDGKHGPAPVKSPEHQHHRGDDFGRRM